MNGRISRQLRKIAVKNTVGYSAKKTRVFYQFLKSAYIRLRS